MYLYSLGYNVRHNLTSLNTASYLRNNSVSCDSEVLTTVLLKILIFRDGKMSMGQYFPKLREIVVPSSSVLVLGSLTLNMHDDPQKRIKLLPKDTQ